VKYSNHILDCSRESCSDTGILTEGDFNKEFKMDVKITCDFITQLSETDLSLKLKDQLKSQVAF